MRNLFFGIAFLGALMTSPVAAQSSPDGFGAKRAVSPQSIGGQVARYRVTDMCSISGTGRSCLTVLQINNLRPGSSCNVGAEFYPGAADATTTPYCTVTYASLGAQQQVTLCSRDYGNPESCNVTCSPPPTFTSGYATIYSSCAEIGVQATIVTTNSDDSAITSRTSVNLFNLQASPLVIRANRGN